MTVNGVKTSAYVRQETLDRARECPKSLGELIELGLEAFEAPGRAAWFAGLVSERVSESVRVEVREAVQAEVRAALGELRGGFG